MKGHKIHANIGLSFPTGSIREKDRLPAPGGGNVRARLPYPMQLGSGTFDFLPGLTYLGHAGQISWGAQARGEIRLEENDEGYTKGNEYALTGWGAYEFNHWVSASLRLEWLQELNYRGSDPLLNPAVVPTAANGILSVSVALHLCGVLLVCPLCLLPIRCSLISLHAIGCAR